MLGRKAKILTFIAGTVFFTVLALAILTHVLERKNSDEKYADFFSQEEDFDVLFLGTSHVINGVFPMEMWGDHGIVSYNIAGHANKLPVTYWTMINALDYTEPKLVVIDCLKIPDEIKTNENLNYLHLSMDAFPLSVHKAEAVHDLLDDPYMPAHLKQFDGKYDLSERTAMRFLWNFSIYHARWNKLNDKDTVFDEKYEKGAESRIGVSQTGESVSTNEIFAGETTGVRYLKKMLKECEKRDIEVLLTYLPYPAEEEDYAAANRMEELADAYNVRSINFLKEDIVDPETDYYDEHSHLNPSGAKKVSAYLSDYITNYYDIPDRREDPAYVQWDTDYEEYCDYKEETLVKQEKLDTYLMLLADDDYEINVQVNDPIIYTSEKYS
ncbi:MAG: hypothetical protein K6G07_03105, partial [Lachnospiraceae bacterium]|nr:hypothetical protein [Lachnospiraceae bacterium]